MTTRVRTDEFVGRIGELELLNDVFVSLERGRAPAAAVLVGEPGAGKSRLLREALARGKAEPTLHLVGFEPEQQVPLAAASDALRELAKAGAPGERLDKVLHGAEGPLEPLRVFEAVHRALSSLGPALISFDDLQWADDMSLALAHYLLRSAAAEGSSLALICASRPGPHLPSLVEALRGVIPDESPFIEITLGPLDRDEGIQLAQAIDPALMEDSAEELWQRGGGSPFWIERLARPGTYPERSETAITTWLHGLGRDAAVTLSVLTVAARPLRQPDLASILSWDGKRVDHSVSELINRGLVSSVGLAVQISHDLIREQARRQLPERELTRLHGDLADWLESHAGNDLKLLMEALEHQIAAGLGSVALALKVATSPRRRLMGLDGLAQLAGIADGADPLERDALSLQAEVAKIASELAERAVALERWTALSDRLTTGEERAAAAVEAARNAIDLKRSAEAKSLLDRARSQASGDGWIQVEADALDHARLAWLDHDLDSATESMRRAVATARHLVDEAGSVEALGDRARRAYVEALRAEYDVALMSDDVEAMLLSSDALARATRGLGEEHLIAQVRAATALWYVNRMREAESRLNRVLQEARSLAFPALIVEVSYPLAFTKYNLGQLDEAGALQDDAMRLEERLGSPNRKTVPWVSGGLRHLITAARGDWQGAFKSLQREAEAQADPHSRVRFRGWAAACGARFGGPDWSGPVRSELELGEADGIASGCPRCLWEGRLASAEFYARVGDPERASELLAQWDAAHPTPHVHARFDRTRSEGVLALTIGRDDAVPLLQQVVELAQAAELRMDELWARIDLAGALAREDRERAIEAWNDARRLAEELGATSQSALIQRELRALGARAWSRSGSVGGDSPLARLSARELEVARLAASGSRNAEIAETLFLSPKTVERHLSNVFAKLDVRNRAELGSRFALELADGSTPSED